ncbi:MAG: tyrosine-type recombinase/integrase, partial [Candidatus Acidiferrales bacterium]
PREQHVAGGSEILARRRFQKGSLFVRGKRCPVWVARWREDVIESEKVRRIYRSEVLGTLEEFSTRKLAERELQSRLSTVNDPGYRARPTATFQQFASRWEAMVLSQHKPSHQATVRSQIRKYLVPFFGRLQLREIRPELVQRFLSGLQTSPKTVRNLYVTLRSMWKSARAWSYVAHEICDGIVLPKHHASRAFFFTLEEVLCILRSASEPHKTLYWLAAETGLRAGELTGLRVDDLDLERRLLHVRQSAWRGKIQTPKTENAYRFFALSPELCRHLAEFLRGWCPNEARLLFATRGGTPMDSNLVVKRKLHPLLRSLGIDGGGLHAFRHANETMMDRLNVPMKVRQERLGHSDPRITLGTYTHTVSEDHRRVAVQLGEILHPTCTQLGCKSESAAQEPALVH